MAKKHLNVKSSIVLERALAKLLSGEQAFACCAIMDTELDLSNENNGMQIKSNALQIFQQFKPAIILDTMKSMQQWWPKGDDERIVTVNKAINVAKKKGD
jgi:hypothetical protein